MRTGNHRALSRRHKYLPWVCAIVVPLMLLGLDGWLRHRERNLYQDYVFESARRSMTDWTFKDMLHFKNASTGDTGDVTFSKHGVEGTIEFHPEISSQSKTWNLISGIWRILPYITSTLLLLGATAFFMPLRQRPWAVMVAMLGIVVSLLSPNDAEWFVFGHGFAPGLLARSLVPLVTLVVVFAAALIHPQVKNPRACDKCKYDLTGNTSGICPECGTPIPPPPRVPDIDMLAGNLDLIE